MRTVVALFAFALAACSSPETSPSPGADGGSPVGSDRDGASPPSGDHDAAPPQGGEDAAPAATSLRCYVGSGSCVCLDPAPGGYDSVTCPALPCCWKDTTHSPQECACADFQGQQCDSWRSGPAVPSCP